MVLTLGLASFAQAQEPFYQGKLINIFTGTPSGGTMTSARIIGQYLGKYFPGNPSITVQSLVGGANVVATNHVFNVAKPDGLTLLAANPNVPSRVFRRRYVNPPDFTGVHSYHFSLGSRREGDHRFAPARSRAADTSAFCYRGVDR